MEKTISQYDAAFALCKDIFLKKTKDYGTAWRILRPSSLTDQLFIKAQRIRTIQESGVSKVNEGIESEFVGIVNYSVMALIQLSLSLHEPQELEEKRADSLYEFHALEVRDLMIAKNHDYGEAWRDMRISSLTDLILMKVLRLKQIEDNRGTTLISEGPAANYMDMANYALFALIKLHENPN